MQLSITKEEVTQVKSLITKVDSIFEVFTKEQLETIKKIEEDAMVTFNEDGSAIIDIPPEEIIKVLSIYNIIYGRVANIANVVAPLIPAIQEEIEAGQAEINAL